MQDRPDATSIRYAPGAALTKRSSLNFLSRPEPLEGRPLEEGRERRSQTLNMDLSLTDRGHELGLESIHLRPEGLVAGAEARCAASSTKSICRA